MGTQEIVSAEQEMLKGQMSAFELGRTRNGPGALLQVLDAALDKINDGYVGSHRDSGRQLCDGLAEARHSANELRLLLLELLGSAGA